MKPLIAIVGRPNVGKSMLFNKLVGQRWSYLPRPISNTMPSKSSGTLFPRVIVISGFR